MPDDLAAILKPLEELHLLPIVREDRDRLASILHESFTEIGASGRIFSRDEILGNLPTEPSANRVLDEFNARLLSDVIALTTYAVSRTDPNTGTVHRSRRSSIWKLDSGNWRMVFHQGTPL